MELDYYIHIYRDEDQILIEPWVLYIDGWNHPTLDVIQINDIENEKLIGEGVLKGIEDIKKSGLNPIVASAEEMKGYKTWKKYTKYKSLKKFLLNVDDIIILIKEKRYIIYIHHDAYLGRHYMDIDEKMNKKIYLPLTASAEEIGRAVIEILDASDAIYKDWKEPDPYPEEEIELESNQILIFKTPEDERFVDEGDCNTMEIYKAYKYVHREDVEPKVWFSIEDAANFLSLPSKEEVEEIWKRYYKCIDNLEVVKEEKGIFNYKAEMRNKKVHIKSYFKELENSEGEKYVLECKLEVGTPDKSKKLEEKVEKLFDKFVKSIRFKDE